MNPVQRALSSVAVLGTTAKFRSDQAKRDQREEEHFRERMDIAHERIELDKKSAENYAQQNETAMYNAKTNRKIANTEMRKIKLEEDKLKLEQEKMRQAAEAASLAQQNGNNARNAAETRKMIQYGGYSVPILGGEKNA